MTPLLKHHDPDERPSLAEIVGAIALALALVFTWWLCSILAQPIH